MRFQLVGLSTLSMPWLCLKNPQMEDEIIYPELLMARVVRLNKLHKFWQLKDKENSLLTS